MKGQKILLQVKVPTEQTALVTIDAKEFRKSKDGVVQIALEHFFCLKKIERSMLYRKLPNKIFGRPIK